MPRVINPTDTPLFCAAAHELLPPHGDVQVTQEVADNVPRTVFQIEADEPVEAAVEASPAVPAPTPAAEIAEAEKLLAAVQAAEADKQGE